MSESTIQNATMPSDQSPKAPNTTWCYEHKALEAIKRVRKIDRFTEGGWGYHATTVTGCKVHYIGMRRDR